MRVYQVGGAVRDALLGLPVSDRDWVVVGSTPEDMERLGYLPVGRDFPVFLHPQTREEYALARTERKTARGYKGFAIHASPEVTLEEDLARRDLTVNAMARDESGTLIDPFGGERDLREGVLRHVSPAFSEDPVRILRVARFAARFGFTVAPETAALMRDMVSSGETDALVAERVWQELSRGLMERDPSRMLAELAQCGLLARSYPGLQIDFEHGKPANENTDRLCRALGLAASEGLALPVRFALLARALRDDESALEAFCESLRVPQECRECAVLAGRAVALARDAARLVPMQMLSLVEMADAFRRPRRLDELLDVAEAETYAARHWREVPYRARHAAREGLRAARNVDAASLAAQGGDIGARIRAARYANVLKAMGPSAAAKREGTT